jgi:hypothetical protein
MEGTDSESETNAEESTAEHSTSSASVTTPNLPRVVKFGYREFTVKGSRWNAACKKCSKRIQDKVAVTSAFTK